MGDPNREFNIYETLRANRLYRHDANTVITSGQRSSTDDGMDASGEGTDRGVLRYINDATFDAHGGLNWWNSGSWRVPTPNDGHPTDDYEDG